ncbi:MAG TPA: hypothetical protein VFO32_01165 [Sphingomicrobium sp.]|jgi:hypothetical protein|nr:hypothetical protein [Sphingomicrobium sp.]
MRVLLSLILLPTLSGCVVASVADAAVDIVTLPVDVAAKGVDMATTSQSEADEKRGREVRKAEEKAGKEAREAAERCRRGKPRPADVCAQPN